MTLAALDAGILGPAFIAGLLVLLTHVPLGCQVLGRGIVFIDLAIAQIAGLGVIAADVLDLGEGGWAVQVSAVSAALLGALVLTWTEKRWPEIQEALIGVLFVLASCAGLVLLAGNPHGGEHLRDLLVGQILWVGETQLWAMACVTAAIGLLWQLGGAFRQHRLFFHAVFALAVTASVQLVGVYLVFACLIVPALATRGLDGLRRMVAGYLLGALAFVVGLALSALADLPAGAVIVLGMAALALPAALLARRWIRC
ncbi:metal ABC transporter permease [Viridibacterium curvum]|uniref:Metal ABC transporter permease n=1 Tax=Viridibacterium curvum TaxID=1101404 RepID=A0ABP9R020_9RHOO